MGARGGLAAAGTAGLAAAAVGAALGWLAERRLLGIVVDPTDPEVQTLRSPLDARVQQVVAADGTRLHAEILGPDDAPTIVLVHGYAMSQATWHYQRRDLSGQFRIVSYDQRGHGVSDPAATDDYTMDALGGDLAAVLDQCVPSGRRAVVAGHSMGAMSVLSCVEQSPELLGERVAGVVLIDTTGRDVIAGSVFGGVLGGMAALAEGLIPHVVGLPGPLGRRGSDLTYLGIRAIALCPKASPAHVALTESLAMDCPATVRAALIPAFTSLDLDQAAALVGVPSLVLVGDGDRLTPPPAARRLAALLPDAEFVELPGSGHMSTLEAHEEVTAHLRAFAARVLPDGG